MRKGNIGVAPEGLPFLFLLALTALAFAALRFWPLALVFLVLTWFSGHFFRDPERVVPSEDDIAVSPADGRVIRVEPKADPITGEVRPCISIFMNVFNVHVNRSPVAGRVEAIVIKDMSRLGRDYLKVGQVMEILRQRGVRLIAIHGQRTLRVPCARRRRAVMGYGAGGGAHRPADRLPCGRGRHPRPRRTLRHDPFRLSG